MVRERVREQVLAAVDGCAAELVEFASALIRIPTVNPPGDAYPDCAAAIGDRLRACGFAVTYFPADGCPEHTPAHPRINVVGRRQGERARPTVHLNGHFDVVPPGSGWTVDPFGGTVTGGRIYGRGACDMKAGIAAAVYAAEAIRRAGVALNGAIEISGTVDEESGGFAGVAWLAERGHLTARTVDHVIIPEPLNVDRVCLGHRGVYWFEVTTHGRIAHGSMPFLGTSAIDHMTHLLARIGHDLMPRLAARTTAVPVVPELARHATLNVNGIAGGQPIDGIQTPCVADLCRTVFDRRFLLEEGFEATRREIVALLDRAATEIPGFRYDLRDLMVVHPTHTPPGVAAGRHTRSAHSRCARPPVHARGEPRHLRPQTRAQDWRHRQLRRLRAWHSRPRPPARRVVRRGRPRQRDEGAGTVAVDADALGMIDHFTTTGRTDGSTGS